MTLEPDIPLNYLRTFPFDKIKIDRSFVNDLENREDCRAIVSAVIGLLNNLGMVTLAEGVEDAGPARTIAAGGAARWSRAICSAGDARRTLYGFRASRRAGRRSGCQDRACAAIWRAQGCVTFQQLR
ncbi:MAG: EAL domain-containing protein [Sphingomonadales bacterium]|nr:EAL domain-containing protein [Sphingomonadales bacterium]